MSWRCLVISFFLLLLFIICLHCRSHLDYNAVIAVITTVGIVSPAFFARQHCSRLRLFSARSDLDWFHRWWLCWWRWFGIPQLWKRRLQYERVITSWFLFKMLVNTQRGVKGTMENKREKSIYIFEPLFC